MRGGRTVAPSFIIGVTCSRRVTPPGARVVEGGGRHASPSLFQIWRNTVGARRRDARVRGRWAAPGFSIRFKRDFAGDGTGPTRRAAGHRSRRSSGATQTNDQPVRADAAALPSRYHQPAASVSVSILVLIAVSVSVVLSLVHDDQRSTVLFTRAASWIRGGVSLSLHLSLRVRRAGVRVAVCAVSAVRRADRAPAAQYVLQR